ncbi:MAG: hypothetical protein U0487_00800 [Patescibacteria group bacterium]
MSKPPSHYGEFLRLSYAIYNQDPKTQELILEQTIELLYSEIGERLPYNYGRVTANELEFTLISNLHSGTDELTIVRGAIQEEEYDRLREAFNGEADTHTVTYAESTDLQSEQLISESDVREDDDRFETVEEELKQITFQLSGPKGLRIFFKRFDALFLVLQSDTMRDNVGAHSLDVSSAKTNGARSVS